MSVLLIGLDEVLGPAAARRLIAQGDEVRVVEPLKKRVASWRDAGVYVAAGEVDDDDLVERAAQNVRTVVVGESLGLESLEAVFRGAKRAAVGRVIVCTPRAQSELRETMATSGFDYIILETGAGRFLRRKTIAPELLAEAIDAADDLAGDPALILDLTDEASWAELRVDPPPTGV